MPRGRKNKSLDERIQDTQQSIYNLEVRTQELYEELEELLRQKKNEELEKLSDALEEAGVSVDVWKALVWEVSRTACFMNLSG